MSKAWWAVTAVLALAGTLLGNQLLLLLSVFLLLTGLVSLLWTRVCLAEVHYQRRLGRLRLFHGEETELQVEIVNAKPLPLAWLRVEDEVPAVMEVHATKLASSHRSGRARLVNVLSLRWYERVTRRYRVRLARRGVYHFGPVELASGDIFGFAINHHTLRELTTLLVYPKVVPLTAFGLPALRPFGDFSTERRLAEDPLRLMGAREYASGDSFRHIHWKATAHRQALQTKVFEPSASRPLAIFLNINTFEARHHGVDTELQEFAIAAAASVANWAWENGHAVGLFANAIVQPEAQRVQIKPRHHPDQLLLILEALAKVVNYGRWPIERVIQLEASHLPYGATVVVVTALLDDALRRTLLDLRAREYGVTVLTLGAAQTGPRLPGVHHVHIGGREEWADLASLALVG